MAVAGNRGGEEVNEEVPDDKVVAEMYKYGGAFSLIGLEFSTSLRRVILR
jgi:hypothetical protein